MTVNKWKCVCCQVGKQSIVLLLFEVQDCSTVLRSYQNFTFLRYMLFTSNEYIPSHSGIIAPKAPNVEVQNNQTHLNQPTN